MFRNAKSRCPAGECNGYGEVIVDGCTCGAGPGGYYGMHERGCGSEPCPAGCEYVPHENRALASGEATGSKAKER